MTISASVLADAVIGTSSDAIVACDKDGNIRFWNRGAERIFGFTSSDALGQSLDIIIPERLRARHWEGYRRVMATGESRYGHGDVLAVPGIRKDGTGLSLEFTIVPLRDQTGQMTGMAAIMRDVTARFEEMRSLRRKLAEASKRPG
ncbi:MAG TPA: PAS domain S-box protein [Hyphomicrobiaceae bacterium]|jgi:PAS domain S-box-containing protein|nr:PAS domain S-box protein [Hyphomicrobiaceae bacterium]